MAAPRLCPPPTALPSTRAPARAPLGQPRPHPGAPQRHLATRPVRPCTSSAIPRTQDAAIVTTGPALLWTRGWGSQRGAQLQVASLGAPHSADTRTQ